MSTPRTLQQVYTGLPASDGAGVKLTRIIGQPQLKNLDPFLMLDAFGTDQPQDYIGGFPPHPHRGFETVTYLLAGRMRHSDNQGNQGVIEPGGVQWMTAGRGIIHSEMPEQEEGLLMGFQLWVNLPAHAKMTTPSYQEYAPEQVPEEVWPNGTRIKVIAGKTERGTQGVIQNNFINPTYLDVQLPPGERLVQTFPMQQTAFIYLHEGQLKVGKPASERTLQAGQLGVLSHGEHVTIENRAKQISRFLLVAGSPLNEPIVQRGPFVMNTQAEIMQAFDDYQNGRF
ncbi:pirin family protein [Thiomicrorhabdus sp. zzn3]|uniref:pirin family protein n=1 Tax=Thiomicrorhabdus sp. zzn3 TaxID=3039775 RepID=UPI00243667B3|nr:pirin family protein [Thiomicrorhabdus sp. zzn3]MDG6778519.1 pirin family protein [Thiomicrorhabdus sp. zzn3]